MLPLIQLFVYAALIWIGRPYRTTIGGSLPFSEQLADGVNFPAACAGMILYPVVYGVRTSAAQELTQHLITTAFVVILWFLIGKAVERRRMSERLLRSHLARALMDLGLLGTALFGALILTTFGYDITANVLFRLFALSWCAVGTMFLWRKLRAPTRTPI